MAEHVRYILGLDLGSNSLGWAALRLEGATPAGILASGVRIFPAGVAQLESGRDESHAKKRREARLQRRQTDRRRRRIQKVYNILASYGLLPRAATPAERTTAINQLDQQISKEIGCYSHAPYLLRAKGLDERLELHQIGRALLHLAQRRGVSSNRKTTPRDESENKGAVKENITQLENEVRSAGCRTLGEFFAHLNPEKTRIRNRYTSRKMYLEEFELFWESQRNFYPEILTEQRKKELFDAIFHQRPLRDQSKLIGSCELEPEEKRAPLWHPYVQRLRMLQEVNNLRLIDTNGAERTLTSEERAKVLAELKEKEKLSITCLKKLLGLAVETEINFERGGKKDLLGDRTNVALRKVFGKRWDNMTENERLSVVETLASDLVDEALAAHAREHFGLDPEAAERYASVQLEFGKYCAFSLKAIRKLMPLLEAGMDVTSARIKAYPESFRTQILNSLPPVTAQLKEIRNPAVVRALVLVQPEMEKGRSPEVSFPPLRGGGFQGMGVYRSDGFRKGRRAVPARAPASSSR